MIWKRVHRKHNIQIKLPSPVRPARCPRSWDFGGATGAEYLTLTLGMRVDVAISSMYICLTTYTMCANVFFFFFFFSLSIYFPSLYSIY